MENITIIEDFSYAFSILNYALVGGSIGIMCICLFWIWYFIMSVCSVNRELVNKNRFEMVNNNECRKSSLKAQRTKYNLFIGIMTCEFLKKTISLLEYFYIVNVFQDGSVIELSDKREQMVCNIEYELMEHNLKTPGLIFIQALNLTSTLCLASLIGMALFHLSKMFTVGRHKTTSLKAMVIFLATKAVFVLILSSTIWLYIVGYFVWLTLLFIEWLLICFFAGRLYIALSHQRFNKDLPVEFTVPSNSRVTKQFRIMKIATFLVCTFILIYVLAQFFSISVELADIVYFRPCFLSFFGIFIDRHSMADTIAYLTTRDALISAIYGIVFLFDLMVYLAHIYFFASLWRKIAERLSCRRRQVTHLEVDSDDIEKPLMGNYEQQIVDETFVTSVQGSSKY